MDVIGRIVKIVLTVAILAVLVNDTSRYVSTLYNLGNVTRESASRSAAEVKPASGDRARTWQAGETYAEQAGAVVYGFDMNEHSVHVWTRMPVKGTWVVHRVVAALDGKPQDTLLDVQDEASIVLPSN